MCLFPCDHTPILEFVKSSISRTCKLKKNFAKSTLGLLLEGLVRDKLGLNPINGRKNLVI
jgi:hypothetical protein